MDNSPSAEKKMKIDWRKELEFQRDQLYGMFDGLGSEIALTLIIMSVTVVPLFSAMYLIDLIIRSI
jgi:hypothetical protein